MNKDIFFATGRRSLWLIIQVIIFIICVGYIEFVYYADILPDKKVAETFVQTTCTLLDKKLQESVQVIHKYRADFSVSYSVQGKIYSSQTSANGLDRSFTTDRASEEKELNRFNQGKEYTCWYDPNMPALVVLVPRHSWSSTLPLLIPAVIAIVMIYYILRTLFAAAGAFARRARENKHRKKNNIR